MGCGEQLRKARLWPLWLAAFFVVGGLVAALFFPHEEWPYYLSILGSAIAFIAFGLVSWGADGRPQRLLIAALAFWTFAAGVLLDVADQNDSLGQVTLALGVFGAGIVVFFGMLFLPREQGAPGVTDGAMRHAVAAAFFAVFLALLTIGVFYEDLEGSPLGEKLTDDLVKWFGVAISFYFGSTAFVEVASIRARLREDETSH